MGIRETGNGLNVLEQDPAQVPTSLARMYYRRIRLATITRALDA